VPGRSPRPPFVTPFATPLVSGGDGSVVLGVTLPVAELLPETELIIESATVPDTDNVSPFPKSKLDRGPDAVNDAMLDFTAAVRLCTVVPAAPDVEDGDDDKSVVGVVVDGSVIRDPPLLGSCATGPTTFRPRREMSALPAPPAT